MYSLDHRLMNILRLVIC